MNHDVTQTKPSEPTEPTDVEAEAEEEGGKPRKPFCDSTHKNIDFDAPSIAPPPSQPQ